MSQRRQANRTPYSQVLSSIRKADLVRLCGEFGLPNDGSVVVLRNRLKDYLNLHRNALYRNPRYTALFPRFRRANQPLPPPPSTASSSVLSYRSHSVAASEESWIGIQEHDDGNNVGPAQVQQQHPPVPMQPIHPFMQPDHHFQDPPPPPPSPSHSDRSSTPSSAHSIDGREY